MGSGVASLKSAATAKGLFVVGISGVYTSNCTGSQFIFKIAIIFYSSSLVAVYIHSLMLMPIALV